MTKNSKVRFVKTTIFNTRSAPSKRINGRRRRLPGFVFFVFVGCFTSFLFVSLFFVVVVRFFGVASSDTERL